VNTTSFSLLQQIVQAAPPAAWDRFVDLYTPLLYYWARRLGLQAEDAADLVQDVFMVLVRKLPEFSYDPARSFRGWLRTIVLNQWRMRRRRPVGPPLDPCPPALAELPDRAEDDPFEEAEYRRHLAARALQLMQTDFQPSTWKACWECIVAGRPAADVAAELGLTAHAVRAAKFRVLCRLRQELEGLLD
jgi:RNA polymerase sigma-70 factor (ECF subfamily)